MIAIHPVERRKTLQRPTCSLGTLHPTPMAKKLVVLEAVQYVVIVFCCLFLPGRRKFADVRF